jgi:hypothetical protein
MDAQGTFSISSLFSHWKSICFRLY